ncbi:translation initiation factor IF-2-like isoform X1 [Bombus bifarius]|uniref:Translation initiation factor IF-2-like isoform X1 n=1 Tax=Bombus bifarius TaxID=103933 RepID=A0A6P8NR01_9HYME|nr:translation initiation factor IF-2-like isoform X1 [Bombus bifarius]XP_033316861.1 translation initiation factor IF-2-like isoform X1 [Bombus bifarius]
MRRRDARIRPSFTRGRKRQDTPRCPGKSSPRTRTLHSQDHRGTIRRHTLATHPRNTTEQGPLRRSPRCPTDVAPKGTGGWGLGTGGNEEEKEEKEEDERDEDNRRRRRRGGKKRIDHATTDAGTAAAAPARQDDRRTETERPRNAERITEDTQAGHAASRTVNIRGDPDAERGSEDVVRRRSGSGQNEDPAFGARNGTPGNEKGDDGGHHNQSPWRQGQRKGDATGDASSRGAGPDGGENRHTDQDGGATRDRDRHFGQEGGAAESTGLGGRMRQRGGTGGRDRRHQRRPRDGMDQVSGSRGPQAGPGREDSPGLVNRQDKGHPEAAVAVLQVPGTGARTRHLRIQRRPRAPVLQVRRERTPRQRLSRLHSQVPPVRVARGAREPQDGRRGMHSPESQEEATNPPTSSSSSSSSRERDTRKRRRTNSGGRPGGGHGGDRIIQAPTAMQPR